MPYDAPSGEQPKAELAPVYKPEGRRLRQSNESEATLKAKAEAARERAVALQERPVDDAERLKADMDFQESNLDLETFDLTHDPTGALKREAIGADLAAQLAEMMPSEKEPKPSVVSFESITPVFMVNMGELDRLNKVSPDFGNEALTSLADQISAKLETALGPIADGELESYYKIYRADNNSFMVRFMRQVPKEVAEALREHLASEAGSGWEGESDPFAAKGVESPPVISDYVSLEEVMAGLPPSLRGSGKAETFAVGAVKDVLISMQEAHKIVSRFERVRDKLGAGEADARDLYDKFLKKSLTGVFSMESGPDATEIPVESFEQFQDYVKSLESNPHAEGAVWEAAYGKVLEDLRIRYEKDSRYTKQIQGFVADKVKAEYGLSVHERRSSVPPGAELPKDKPATEFVAPSRDQATEGLRAFARLRNDVATWTTNLERAKAQGASAEEIAGLEQHLRITEKEFAREKVLRDSATGLELRGSMFKNLEAAINDGTKRVAAVSMDMGFLKYFDQVGGRETGDTAILKMAELFQKVSDELSTETLKLSVHRLGGDEFGMTVVGEQSMSPDEFRATLALVQERLRSSIDEAGRVPPGEGAKPGYFATKLNLSLGTHFYEDGQAAAAEDAKYELTDASSENVTNSRAEHLLKVADKVMGFQKAASRFQLMLERMKALQESRSKGAPDEDIHLQEEHLKQLMAFSDKAMFGQAGRDMLKEWGARLADGETLEQLDQDVHDFVWEHMEETFQQEVVERGDLESAVEYAVRIEYLGERVRTLESRLEKLGKTDESQRKRAEHDVSRLKEKLSSAEEDLEKMKTLRASLGAGSRV